MFIETLEFTIPVDLCSLCTTLQKSTQSGLEFPASVNSYGTTQDASIQVALKANKLTFKVDGVSSNASIISKSECRTLKLSVFDVDRTLIPQESDTFSPNNVSNFHQSTPAPNSQKRTYDPSPTPVRAKIRRNSGGEIKKTKSPNADRVKDSYLNNRSKPMDNCSNNVLIKTEPEDPDLIEIDPDPEPLKTEQPEQSSSCMYDQTSHSSYEQNVPHVQDYSEPSTSRQHPPSQNVDDFLVFQDDSYENDDNEEYSNDELFDVMSTPKGQQRSDAPDSSSLLELLMEKDKDIKRTLKLAEEQAGIQKVLDGLKAEVDSRDQDIKNLQRNLKEAETILETAMYQAKQKLDTISQASRKAISSEELIKFAHRISASNAVAAPVTWQPGDPRRPYPTELEMRHGWLAQGTYTDSTTPSRPTQQLSQDQGTPTTVGPSTGLSWQSSQEMPVSLPSSTSQASSDTLRGHNKDTEEVELMSSDSSSSSSSDE